MCELIAVSADNPFAIAELWPVVERLERFGIAGFGWGAAWRRPDGTIDAHRDPRAFRDDAIGRDRVGAVETSMVLIHLRRPSRLSTLSLADTQPFLDPAGRFAFGHNGDLVRHGRWRDRYRSAGRIHGRADSEVGARWLEDEWGRSEPPTLLAALHDAFGGQANLAVLEAAGRAHVYAGNAENPVFGFRLGRMKVVSTGIHSLDRSLFRFVAPAAAERQPVAFGSVVSLAVSPTSASPSAA